MGVDDTSSSQGGAEGDLLRRVARLEAELAQLRASEELLRRQNAILETTSDIVGSTDAQGRVLYLNRAARQAVGLGEQESVEGRHISDFHPEWAFRHVMEVGLPTALRDGSWMGETAVIHRERGTLPVSQVILAHRNAGGAVVSFSTIMRDISALKASEQALQVALQRQRLHVEQTPLAVIEWDLGFRVVAWNPAAEAIFGYSQAEAIGQHAMFILPPELERAIVDELWNDLLTQRGGTRSTNSNVTKDGRAIICEWYNTPLVDQMGTTIGVTSLVQDITAQRAAEEERAATQEQIIAAQQEALRELSTPLIPLADSVVVMPLIGSIDSARAEQVLSTLLNGVTSAGASTAIIDITGVPIVDTQVANALLRAAQAVKLLGAQTVLTGIRPEVAQTLVGLGASLQGIVTRSTLQSGIAFALSREGVTQQ